MAILNFDATTVSPKDLPIPADWYNAMIVASEMKPTKTGGEYLFLTFKILDGQYVGRQVTTNLNIKNANEMAQTIAFKQLSAIAHAVNILQVSDSSQLHGQPLKIKVKVREAQGDFDEQNDIASFKNINEAVRQVIAPAAVVAPVRPPAFVMPPAQAWQPPAQAVQPWAQVAPAPTAVPVAIATVEPVAAVAAVAPAWNAAPAEVASTPPWAVA